MSIPVDTPSDRIIRIREVMHLVGEGRTTIYEKIKKGKFPKQKKLGSKSVGWSYLEIHEYVRITLAGGEYIRPKE
jgi:prophage regulatory protein